MANGSVAHLPELLSAPVCTDTDAELGSVVASAVTALCFALQAHQQNGCLTDEIRTTGSERIAKLAQLRLDSLGVIDDFDTVARAAAKPVLRQYLDADFFCRYSMAEGEAALDLYITDVLGIVARVVAVEMTFRN